MSIYDNLGTSVLPPAFSSFKKSREVPGPLPWKGARDDPPARFMQVPDAAKQIKRKPVPKQNRVAKFKEDCF